jgi:hypothetical protein
MRQVQISVDLQSILTAYLIKYRNNLRTQQSIF